MPRPLLTLAAFCALLGPLAASAQTPPAPPTPPAAPAPPATPPVPKHHALRGRISATDAAKRTITLVGKKKNFVVTLAPDAKIYKIGDKRRDPTGTFADLLVDTPVSARLTDDTADSATPVATEVHIRAPKADAVPKL